MILLHKTIPAQSRSNAFWLYVLGDTHIGARNCAELHIKRLIAKIKDEPRAFWIGGGDYINAIKPQDIRRFKPEEIPDWMLDGDADTVRKKLRDIVCQESLRFSDMVEPIKNKCIGLIKGNHEDTIERCYNEAIHQQICQKIGAPDLTDAAFIRFNFEYKYKSWTKGAVVILFICHGWGGGRTPGTEPNRLYRLAADKEADIILQGHSHLFCLLPPIPVLSIPRSGQLPNELEAKYKRAGNWGAWLKSYAVGPSTYDSRACYPARCLSTLEICIEPHKHTTHKGKDINQVKISIRELVV